MPSSQKFYLESTIYCLILLQFSARQFCALECITRKQLKFVVDISFAVMSILFIDIQQIGLTMRSVSSKFLSIPFSLWVRKYETSVRTSIPILCLIVAIQGTIVQSPFPVSTRLGINTLEGNIHHCLFPLMNLFNLYQVCLF